MKKFRASIPLLVITLTLSGISAAQPHLPRSSPEAQGIASADILAFIELADELAAQVVGQLLERQDGLPLDKVEDLVLGCAFPEHTQGMLMARGGALLAGLPASTAAAPRASTGPSPTEKRTRRASVQPPAPSRVTRAATPASA